jgi:16S rRNA (adenine1518-N6/adenine1519-N6)-dimethyltransferase
VQFYGHPQIAMRLNPAVFWPRPEVESAVICVDTYDTPPVTVPDEKLFFQIVRAGFGQKRKQLRNSLSAGLQISKECADEWLAQAEIDPQRRAETLSLEEWAALTRLKR